MLALLHEILADNDQLLSHAFDRWIERHPTATRTATLAFATTLVLHLLNWLPASVDPFHRIGNFKQRKR